MAQIGYQLTLICDHYPSKQVPKLGDRWWYSHMTAVVAYPRC
jgi:hypothetical protein